VCCDVFDDYGSGTHHRVVPDPYRRNENRSGTERGSTFHDRSSPIGRAYDGCPRMTYVREHRTRADEDVFLESHAIPNARVTLNPTTGAYDGASRYETACSDDDI
jgi:hypothetical protein